MAIHTYETCDRCNKVFEERKDYKILYLKKPQKYRLVGKTLGASE